MRTITAWIRGVRCEETITQEEDDLLREQKQIAAIKLFRKRTGQGLYESKCFTDERLWQIRAERRDALRFVSAEESKGQ